MRKEPISISDHFTYKKLFQFCLPSIFMMIFTSIYGVVDGLFVSNFAGKTAFAAINLIMPVLMILGALGFMVGAGGSALVAKTLGEGEEETANRYFTMLLMLTAIFGIVTTVLGMIFVRPLAVWLGATPEMMDDCVLYGRINILFNTAFMLQNTFQSFLITAEKPHFGLIVTVAAGCTNMVLDALLVGVCRWGVAGAAIATVMSQCVGGVIPLVYFLSKKNTSRLRIVKTKLEARPLLQACGNGSSELMSNISGSIVSMLYNFQLLRYIGPDGVSAYGVLMYVQFIFVAIMVGYAIGSAPIVSFHYGAGNHDEMKNMRKKSLTLMLTAGVVLLGLSELLAAPLAHIFVGYDAGLYELTLHAFRLFSFSFLLMGLNIFTSSFFTALNNGAVSAGISFLRTLVFQTSAVLLLPVILDVDGIWLAVTCAEVLAGIVSASFLLGMRKKYDY